MFSFLLNVKGRVNYVRFIIITIMIIVIIIITIIICALGSNLVKIPRVKNKEELKTKAEVAANQSHRWEEKCHERAQN